MSEQTAELKRRLSKRYDIETFVETGSHIGETAEWASQYFDNVITIEFEEELYLQARNERGHIRNIEFIHGKSQEKLKQIVPEIDGQCMFYLDAHCMGRWESAVGANIQSADEPHCPLPEELEIIADHSEEHFIFIDDSWMFLRPPRQKYDETFPSVREILEIVNTGDNDYYFMEYEGEIVLVPAETESFIREAINDIRQQEVKRRKPSTIPQKVVYTCYYEGYKPFQKKLFNTGKDIYYRLG